MEIRLKKWGNSVGVRIPSVILKTLNLKTNDIISLSCEDDKIVISKQKKKRYHLRKNLKNILVKIYLRILNGMILMVGKYGKKIYTKTR